MGKLPPAIPLDELVKCYKTDPKMTHQKWVLWACECAERVLEVYQNAFPNDHRPREAIAAARRWVADPTLENADAAYAAHATAYDAYATNAGAYAAADTAYAAYAAADTAFAAADTAYAAANATRAASHAAYAAYAAAYAANTAADAAYAAAYAAARASLAAARASLATACASLAATDPEAESLWQAVKLMEIYHA
jgi:hypothetical protein